MRLAPLTPLTPLTPALTAETQIAELAIERSRLAAGRFARNTVLGYRYDWALFTAWCAGMELPSLPAATETLTLYLTFLLRQGRKISTARRRNCAIAHYHRQAGFGSPVTPEVYRLLEGAQRLRGEKPREMRPLSVAELRQISAGLRQRGTPVALRNRALLVVGFASALRRSNLAALAMRDLETTGRGLVLTVQREKQDQEGKGRLIGIPRGKRRDTCAARCLQDWLRYRGMDPGPVFPRLDRKHEGEAMDGECVCRVIKKCVAQIGLDASECGGHSLRSGFITAAGEANVETLLIAAHTGHRSLDALRRYFRHRNLWRANPCAVIGL